MSVLPRSDLDMIQWFETRQSGWEQNRAAIGISEAEYAKLKNLISAARAAYDAAQAARAASKTATQALAQAANGTGRGGTPVGLRAFGADLVKTIRAFAETSGNPKVYDLANFPPPAPPSPLPPPSQPTDITAGIEPTGAITLRFKATSPGGGAVYMVSRKLANESTFRVIGAAENSRGYKTFTDDTVPAGANNFQYTIRGQRGTSLGPPSAVFTVMIGRAGDGTMTATLKMAA